jgi:hypothetical protein
MKGVIMEGDVRDIGNGNFVAIGKMMIHNLSPNWNIPALHFIIRKAGDGVYEATNIDLILDAEGKTIEESIEALSGLTLHYIETVMRKGRGYDEFLDKAASLVMEDYWRAYRVVDFKLARIRKDLSHELSNKINAAIQNMLAENIKRRIREIAEDIAEDIIIGNMNVEVSTTEDFEKAA